MFEVARRNSLPRKPEFSINEYITVSADLFAGIGGRRSPILRALSTRRALGDPPATPQRVSSPST